MNYGGYFEVDLKKEEIRNLEELTKREDFWTDQVKAEEILVNIKNKSSLVNKISSLKQKLEDNEVMLELIQDEYNKEDEDKIISDLASIEKDIDKLYIINLLNKPYDKENAILEIHSGAGGTEACDWANMLYRMYLRWCEQKNYKTKLISYQEGEDAGIKSVSIEVVGEYAYGYLKCEKGIHRLVRLSPFDANHKRHTSFASVEVTPIIKQTNDIELDEKDLKIDVYRSSGAGGQGVNTTDSAVRVTYLPTKIVVTCQNERSQIQNKEEALNILKSKLLLIKQQEEEDKLNSIKGIQKNIEFGSQIRSYIMHPYSLVKDHRTNIENTNVGKVLDGDIDMFIEANLKK